MPEKKAKFSKLALYEELREIYVLGTRPIPFNSNPLKRPYLSVCRSSRCYPSRKWQPIFEALQTAVKTSELRCRCDYFWLFGSLQNGSGGLLFGRPNLVHSRYS